MENQSVSTMPGDQAQSLLEDIAGWQHAVTTIIIHAGSVFEFKGRFPQGANGHGYYNLNAESGFEGHLKLTDVVNIEFQDKPHRGRDSYAFVFNSIDEAVFKIFLGRDEAGNIHPEQLARFKSLQQQYS